MGDIREELENEISREIENLKTLEPGCEEHTAAVESLSKLYKLHVDEERAEIECLKGDDDERIRLRQLEVQKTDQKIRNGIEIAAIVVPLIFYSAWMRKGLKFEESGTFTSMTLRTFLNKIKPNRV